MTQNRKNPEMTVPISNQQGGFCIIADEDEEMHGIAVFSLDAPDGEVRPDIVQEYEKTLATNA